VVNNNGEEEEIGRQRLLNQAIHELSEIETALANATGKRLKSNWNRQLELSDDVNIRGEKPFTCMIRVNVARMHQETRWRTLIHEMLHAHSAGYNRMSFDALPGWEEGIVEQLQRLLRAALLSEIGVQVDDALFLDEEQTHPYNVYIAALEAMRELLVGIEESPTNFYIALLNVPIRERLTWVMQRGKQLLAKQQAGFLKTFALSSAILRRSPQFVGLSSR
jgi:hypothetical protein